MIDPARIIDPFFRNLDRVIREKLDQREKQLFDGSAVDFADYKGQIAYIRALHDVLQWGEEVERDQYGRKPDGV
jgi:hypothetical protein